MDWTQCKPVLKWVHFLMKLVISVLVDRILAASLVKFRQTLHTSNVKWWRLLNCLSATKCTLGLHSAAVRRIACNAKLNLCSVRGMPVWDPISEHLLYQLTKRAICDAGCQKWSVIKCSEECPFWSRSHWSRARAYNILLCGYLFASSLVKHICTLIGGSKCMQLAKLVMLKQRLQFGSVSFV